MSDANHSVSELLAEPLFGGEGMKQVDAQICALDGISSFELMQRAGLALQQTVNDYWPEVNSVLIVCGKANNAGDGLVLAALLKQALVDVSVLLAGPPEQFSGDAALALRMARDNDVTLSQHESFASSLAACQQADLVIDGLLGTGLSGAPREPFEDLIKVINTSNREVLCIDLPAGVIAETGAVPTVAVKATRTISLVGRKVACVTGVAVNFLGELTIAPLTKRALERVSSIATPLAGRINYQSILPLLPVREPGHYKNRSGHLLIAGGAVGYGGATLLSAMAAYRAGAGLVTVASAAEHRNAVLSACPEAMFKSFVESGDLADSAERAAAMVVGPGAGQTTWSRHLLKEALQQSCPMVIDADALNLIAAGELDLADAGPTERIFTPHPGEAARLLGCDIAAVEADRIAAAQQIANQYGCVCVLKGAGTIVAFADQNSQAGGCNGAVFIADVGSPALAVAGMGDLLAGIIGALLAQGLTPEQAALAGVCIHGEAGWCAGKDQPIGLLPSDCLNLIRELVNGVAQ